MNKKIRNFFIICGIFIGAGIILGASGLILGGIQGLEQIEEKVPWVSFGDSSTEQKTYKDLKFSSINLKNDMDDVVLKEGDEFRVETRYAGKQGSPQIRVEGGTLQVQPVSESGGLINLDIFGKGSRQDTWICITYPEGSNFESVTIENDMGNVTVQNLRTKKLELSCDTGSIGLNQVTAEHLKADVDMGCLRGTGLDLHGANMQISSGEAVLTGSFAGTTKILCDMGNCSLNVEQPKEIYSMDLNNDAGDCIIDGKVIEGGFCMENLHAKNHLLLELDAGNIKVNFNNQ